MTRPAWLGDRALKTRSDRPDDPPLDGPAEAQNRALERARAVQRRRLAGPGKGPRPGEARKNYEKVLAKRRTIKHPDPKVQRIAVRLWKAYRHNTGDYRVFDELDHRRAILGYVSHKEQWWGVATEVVRIIQEDGMPRYSGCVQP